MEASTMYRIHITAQSKSIPSFTDEQTYDVAVLLPGQSSGNVAQIKKHNLEVALCDLLPFNVVQDHLKKAHSREGAFIELESLDENHFNMLRGLPPSAVGQ